MSSEDPNLSPFGKKSEDDQYKNSLPDETTSSLPGNTSQERNLSTNNTGQFFTQESQGTQHNTPYGYNQQPQNQQDYQWPQQNLQTHLSQPVNTHQYQSNPQQGYSHHVPQQNPYPAIPTPEQIAHYRGYPGQPGYYPAPNSGLSTGAKIALWIGGGLAVLFFGFFFLLMLIGLSMPSEEGEDPYGTSSPTSTPTAEDSPKAPPGTVLYMAYVHDAVEGSEDLSNSEIIDYGMSICEAIDEGATKDEISRIFMESSDGSSESVKTYALMGNAAIAGLCPEHSSYVPSDFYAQ